MSSYTRALEIADKLATVGLFATADPRSATPPCVLIPPPERVYDVGCGYTAHWQLVAMVPGPANGDAYKAVEAMVDTVAEVLPVEHAVSISYLLSPDAPALPAFQIEFTEGV